VLNSNFCVVSLIKNDNFVYRSFFGGPADITATFTHWHILMTNNVTFYAIELRTAAVSNQNLQLKSTKLSVIFNVRQKLKCYTIKTVLSCCPRRAYYTTNRQSALGLMFAEFRGRGRRFGPPLNMPLYYRGLYTVFKNFRNKLKVNKQ